MKSPAFTLIELLVVIAVIGLLSSIILVNLTGQRDKARLANAEQFSSSLHHALGDHVVGMWTFDEGIQGSALDTSGYGNDGAVIGATLTTDHKKQNNKAYSFDGLDDGISLTSGSVLDNVFEGGGTIAAWIQIDTAGQDVASGRILDKDGSGTGWAWYITDTGPGFRWTFHQRYASATVIASWRPDDDVLDANWHHVVVTWDSSNNNNAPSFYLDGSSITVTESTAPSGTKDSDVSATLYAGRDESNSRNFDGKIDDVRIYSRALTGEQILANYNAGKSLYFR